MNWFARQVVPDRRISPQKGSVLGMIELMILAAILGAAFIGGRALMRDQSDDLSLSFDLRRSIVLIGPEQNAAECVAQRRALRPVLLRLRRANINVVEIYAANTPRRNGEPLEWLDGDALRRSLAARQGFHLVCLDNEAEIIVHGRRPVSTAMLEELVAGEERVALPAPSTMETPPPNHDGSWSVGVLR